MTVRLLAVSGMRITLGGVPPAATRTLRFTEPLFESGYRLVAELTDGNAVTSQDFQLTRNAAVTWTLRSNALLVSAAGGSPR